MSKTKQEYRKDLIKISSLIALVGFILIVGINIWFGVYSPDESYGWPTFIYVLASAGLAELYVSHYFLSEYGDGHFVTFWVLGIVMFIMFMLVNPIKDLNAFNKTTKWETTKNKTYSKVVFYDDTQTIVNDADGEILDLGRSTYYKMKHAITKGSGSCTIHKERKIQWSGGYETRETYCTKSK